MAGKLRISPYETGVAILCALFLLTAGGLRLWESAGPAPVWVTWEEEEDHWPESLLPGEIIDLNTAGEWELLRLPGIGPARAEAILADRAQNGPFRSVEDLERVKGIGPGILAGLQDYVRADAEG